MTLLFGICATVGVTVLACQFLLTLVGMGGDAMHGDGGGGDVVHVGDVHSGDVHGTHGSPHESGMAEHGTSWFFGALTFRALTAAVAFFGLGGLTLDAIGLSPLATWTGAIGAGVFAMYLVHWLMLGMSKLRVDGTIRIDRAVGSEGTVYIPIPASNQGEGKVTVNIQSREIELAARTPLAALPTGAKVVVTRVLGGETVEVLPAGSVKAGFPA
jgi:membrane protein implicated in regulation of membrane protease activity